MDWDYRLDNSWYYIDLENGKKYRISQKEIETSMDSLELSEFEAVEMWLEDRDILVNEEVNELSAKAKANGVTKVGAKSQEPKKKTQRERVVKENPIKEKIISTLAESLKTLEVDNLTIENKAKLITFTYNGEEFKIDLVQKRKKKE